MGGLFAGTGQNKITYEDFYCCCALVSFAGGVLAVGPCHADSLPPGVADPAAVSDRRAHHRIGLQVYQCSFDVPFPDSRHEVACYRMLFSCSLIFSSSSFIITTCFCISASLALEPMVLISRPISWAIKPSFLPFDCLSFNTLRK